MLFYFVRHGQTEANRQQVLAGSGIDHPLTEEGHQQARQLAEAFKKLVPHPVHRLVSSQMTRAQQTAGYLSTQLELPIEIVSDLREWHLGEWEGQSSMQFLQNLLNGGEPKKGESRQQFYARVEAAFKTIHNNEKPYVIVSHGAVWLALQDLLQIPRFKVDNCSLVRVESKNSIWCAEILNR